MCWEIADGRLSARGYDNFKAGIELDFDFGWLLVVIHRTETSAKEKAKRASSHQNGEKREREKRASEGEGGNTYATHGNTGESPAERNKLERVDCLLNSRDSLINLARLLEPPSISPGPPLIIRTVD